MNKLWISVILNYTDSIKTNTKWIMREKNDIDTLYDLELGQTIQSTYSLTYQMTMAILL